MDSDREGARRTLGSGQSADLELRSKSTKIVVEKGSVWSCGLYLHCTRNRRKWGSKRDPRGRMDSEREGNRQTLKSGQFAGSKFHYKSTKVGAEKASVCSSVLQ